MGDSELEPAAFDFSTEAKEGIGCIVSALAWSVPEESRSTAYFPNPIHRMAWMVRVRPNVTAFLESLIAGVQDDTIVGPVPPDAESFVDGLRNAMQLGIYQDIVKRANRIHNTLTSTPQLATKLKSVSSPTPLTICNIVGNNAHYCALQLIVDVGNRIRIAIEGEVRLRHRSSPNYYFDPATIKTDSLPAIETALRELPEFDAPIYMELLYRLKTEEPLFSGAPQAGNFSDAETTVLAVISEARRRLTTNEIVSAIEKRNGAASLGTTKQTLANLVRRSALNNRQDVKPKGYGLPEWT